MNTKYSKLLKIYIEKLKYFKYSPHTVSSYAHYVEKFLIKIDKYPQHLTGADFQKYLDNFSFSSISQQNQIISAIKLLYEKVLKRKYKKIDFQRPRKKKKLPQIIDYDFAARKISQIRNLKHKAILSIPFTTGLRVSEILNLKITDIDSDRMIIIVHQGKGNKDRIVPLSQQLLELLREYYLKYRPKNYLFEGQFNEKYSPASCNKICKKHLGYDTHMHLLRHTYLTFLADHNVNINTMQNIAGHKSPKTTEIYVHTSVATLANLPTPNLKSA